MFMHAECGGFQAQAVAHSLSYGPGRGRAPRSLHVQGFQSPAGLRLHVCRKCVLVWFASETVPSEKVASENTLVVKVRPVPKML